MLERLLNLTGLFKCNRLNFIKPHKIKSCKKTTGLFRIVVNQGCTRYSTATNKPTTLAYFFKHVTFSGAFWSKFNQINAFFNEWQKATKKIKFFPFAHLTILI